MGGLWMLNTIIIVVAANIGRKLEFGRLGRIGG